MHRIATEIEIQCIKSVKCTTKATNRVHAMQLLSLHSNITGRPSRWALAHILVLH